ncbi:MAG: hypothetical protein ACKOBN_00895 [Flavobacteriales bacterium]
MKNFIKENWYKIVTGTSMLMASFGFMIHAISPAYSSNDAKKLTISTEQNSNSPQVVNGIIDGEYAYFVDGGYVYRWNKESYNWNSMSYSAWSKFKLP